MFELHSQLAKDCVVVGDFPLCRILLNKDSQYPWLILVPRKDAVTEIYQLPDNEQQQLLLESSALSQLLMQVFQGDKMNVAALGNMVPQLHIHHIVRYKTDVAWPNPVWGFATAIGYEKKALDDLLSNMRLAFSKLSIGFNLA